MGPKLMFPVIIIIILCLLSTNSIIGLTNNPNPTQIESNSRNNNLENNEWNELKQNSYNTNFINTTLTRMAVFKWHIFENNSNISYPLVHDGKIFLIENGTIYSIAVETGKIIWLKSEYINQMKKMIINNSLLFICSNNDILVLNIIDGSFVWNYHTNVTISNFFIRSFEVIVLNRINITILNLSSGSLISTLHFSNSNYLGNSAYSDNICFMEINNTTNAMNIQNGKYLWSSLYYLDMNSDFIILDDVIIISNIEKNYIVALNKSNGEIKWKIASQLLRAIASNGNQIVAFGNKLININSQTGIIEWSQESYEYAGGNILLIGGDILIGKNNRLTTFLINGNGKIHWSSDFENLNIKYMIAVNDKIIISGNSLILFNCQNHIPSIKIISPNIELNWSQSDIMNLICNVSDIDKGDFIIKAIFKINNQKNSEILISEEINYANTKFPWIINWKFDTRRLPNLSLIEDNNNYILHIYVIDNNGGLIEKFINFSIQNSEKFQQIPRRVLLISDNTSILIGPKEGSEIRGITYIEGFSPSKTPLEIRICIDNECKNENKYYSAVWDNNTKYYWRWIWDTTEYVNGNHSFYIYINIHGLSIDQIIELINITINNSFSSLFEKQSSTSNLSTIKIGNNIYFKSPQILEIDQSSAQYYWDFGDGNSSIEQNPAHAYKQLGKYLIKCTIYDGNNTIKLKDEVVIIPGNEIDDNHPIYLEKNIFISIIISLSLASIIIGIFSTEIGICKILPLAIGLYSKLKRIEILDNYIRGKIMGIVQMNPGIMYSAIKKELGIPNGSLAYHLSIMEREGFIISSRDGFHQRIYPVNRKIHNIISPEEQILGVIRRTPGIKQKDIAKEVGRSSVQINRILHKLQKGSIVKIIKIGYSTRCYLCEDENKTSSFPCKIDIHND